MATPTAPVLDYAAKAGPQKPSRRLTIIVVLACMYAPYGWLLFKPWPWPDYHVSWVRSWPLLPGLLPGMMCIPDSPDRMFTVMTATTLLAVVLFVWLARRSRRALLATAAVLLALSAANAWAAYAVYRS